MTPDESVQLLENLTSEDVVEFFRSIEADTACPICSSELAANPLLWLNERGEPSEDGKKVSIADRQISRPVQSGTYSVIMPVITTFCDRCGYMADFAVPPILAWLERR